MDYLTMEHLESCFRAGKETRIPFIAIKVQMAGFPKPEVIINELENFDTKLEYYKKAYTDDLILKTFNGIRIVDFCLAYKYADIQKFIVDREEVGKERIHVTTFRPARNTK